MRQLYLSRAEDILSLTTEAGVAENIYDVSQDISNQNLDSVNQEQQSFFESIY